MRDGSAWRRQKITGGRPAAQTSALAAIQSSFSPTKLIVNWNGENAPPHIVLRCATKYATEPAARTRVMTSSLGRTLRPMSAMPT